jgi:uncharacterized protein YceK
MNEWLLRMVVVLAALSLSGCGTVCNFRSGNPEIYGGIEKDVQYLMKPRTEPVSGQKGGPFLLALWCADVTCCALADTLTLPLIVCLERRKRQEDSQGSASPAQYSSGAGAPSAGPLAPPTHPVEHYATSGLVDPGASPSRSTFRECDREFETGEPSDGVVSASWSLRWEGTVPAPPFAEEAPPSEFRLTSAREYLSPFEPTSPCPDKGWAALGLGQIGGPGFEDGLLGLPDWPEGPPF